jgi:hypothetical protein
MKFSGRFKGCVRETIVNSKGVSECEYKAELNIKNVNCSQKTAYLINIKDQEGEFENLSFMEKNDKYILRSPFSNGESNGLTSTYYEGKYLIHQVSFVKTDCKKKSIWTVKYYKLKQC